MQIITHRACAFCIWVPGEPVVVVAWHTQ